jgi:ornithine racemase
MAYLTLDVSRLRKNFVHLDTLFKENSISWGVVTKLLCGNPTFLKAVYGLGIREMHDTRISNLKAIKSLSSDIQTVYIKPPAKRIIPSLVQYADVSFNTDLEAIRAISVEAKRQGKLHKIIIMIEMGDLREGVMGDHLISFYQEVFELPNIEIIGLGTNLNCLNGIMPNQDKLIQLCLYKQLVEIKFNRKIPWVSGGTSVTLTLFKRKQIPGGVNHFRIGEALFFGKDLFSGKTFKGMESRVFTLYAEIIELYEKPVAPIGEQGLNVAGETPEIPEDAYGRFSFRAILDIGLLDINPSLLTPDDPSIRLLEASSDMLVLDLGDTACGYTTGSLVSFSVSYMGALTLMNSNYIEKRIK